MRDTLMLIDITLKITPKMAKESSGNRDSSLVGHLGTHFDVMNQEFPLSYTRRQGIVFDVSAVKERDISTEDVDFDAVAPNTFVAFYTGYIEENEYGTKSYFASHPQLTHELIKALVEKGVSVIGLDFGGVRRGKEHVPADQYCADNGTFVIENLCNLKTVLDHGNHFIAHTYPMNYVGITGIPCRVIAEVE